MSELWLADAAVSIPEALGISTAEVATDGIWVEVAEPVLEGAVAEFVALCVAVAVDVLWLLLALAGALPVAMAVGALVAAGLDVDAVSPGAGGSVWLLQATRASTHRLEADFMLLA